MLTEAQIEIVNDAGQVEDRVRIVGTGQVALATRGTCRFHVPSDNPSDVDAVITLSDGVVVLEAKTHEALRVDGVFLRAADRREVEHELVASITALSRHIHVLTFVSETEWLMSSGGAVIRTQPSELESWAVASAARGAHEVSEQLARLRAQGAIDDAGNLLVPRPADMDPDSETDV